MNTPKSMALGWGVLLLAGAGSFYFAKRDIDARRRAQHASGVRPTEKKAWYERLEETTRPKSSPSLPSNVPSSGLDVPSSPPPGKVGDPSVSQYQR